MSYIIRDLKQLNGTCYIELFPGRFLGSHWNSNSIFFKEYHWELLRPIVENHYPDYNPYGFQTINSSTWDFILRDFKALSMRLEDGAKTADIRDGVFFMSKFIETDLLSDEDVSLTRLKQTIDELSNWISISLKDSGLISVLGL